MHFSVFIVTVYEKANFDLADRGDYNDNKRALVLVHVKADNFDDVN